MDNELIQNGKLRAAGKDMLEHSGVVELLEGLGTVTVRGSYTTGLMTYPDMDFAVQNPQPNPEDGQKLLTRILRELHAFDLRFTDFSHVNGENAAYFVGFKFTYEGLDWQIAATIGYPGPFKSDLPELDEWLAHMTDDQRITIMKLKNELKAGGRYVGSRSTPPYTFRSVHVYEAVLKGGVTTIQELEAYFNNNG